MLSTVASAGLTTGRVIAMNRPSNLGRLAAWQQAAKPQAARSHAREHRTAAAVLLGGGQALLQDADVGVHRAQLDDAVAAAVHAVSVQAQVVVHGRRVLLQQVAPLVRTLEDRA